MSSHTVTLIGELEEEFSRCTQAWDSACKHLYAEPELYRLAAERIRGLEAVAEAARHVLDDARYSPTFRAEFVDGNRVRDLLNALEALDAD